MISQSVSVHKRSFWSGICPDSCADNQEKKNKIQKINSNTSKLAIIQKCEITVG